jgi:hypothetical protein
MRNMGSHQFKILVSDKTRMIHWIFNNFNHFRYLDYNQLSGSIPNEVGNLVNLRCLLVMKLTWILSDSHIDIT